MEMSSSSPLGTATSARPTATQGQDEARRNSSSAACGENAQNSIPLRDASSSSSPSAVTPPLTATTSSALLAKDNSSIDSADSNSCEVIPVSLNALADDSASTRIATLLDLADICRLGLLCRSTRKFYGRRARKACLTQGAGVPHKQRIEFWKCMLNVDKEIADKTTRARKRGQMGDLYECCLYGDEVAAARVTGAARPRSGSFTRDRETGDSTVAEAQGNERGGSDENSRGYVGAQEGRGDASSLPPSGLRALSSEGAEGEISRDVGRTFPKQALFSSRHGPGQNMLANVLKACLKTNPDVGYCQGMNFVAGALLLACANQDPAVSEQPERVDDNFSETARKVDAEGVGRDSPAESEPGSSWEDSDDIDGTGGDARQSDWRSAPAHLRAEKDVFWLMLSLTSRLSDVGSGLGMRELWLPGVPQLKVRVFQFDKLLLQELPRLYKHFKAKQLQLEVLVSQWFLTLFSYSLRPPLLLRVLDLIFTDGWKAMFRFGLARLRNVEGMLCELELEGVSRFLRGFRESDSPPQSPNPAGATSAKNLPWLSRADNASTGSGAVGKGLTGRQSRLSSGRDKARGSSSSSVLKATGEVKVTRSTLYRLQQDFAVQLLKEHLQGEGQWLTRYGSAPEPTPGGGAGVIGGGADGDMGFMGVEAMTRMMLSDSKLLARLKEELAGMAAPTHADAHVFQSKITEASERHEEAAKEMSCLSTELLKLKDDMEALQERKKLVTEQMHLLLVQFEHDSASREGQKANEDVGSRRRTIRSDSTDSSSSSTESGVSDSRLSPTSSVGGFSGFSGLFGVGGALNFRGGGSGSIGRGGGDGSRDDGSGNVGDSWCEVDVGAAGACPMGDDDGYGAGVDDDGLDEQAEEGEDVNGKERQAGQGQGQGGRENRAREDDRKSGLVRALSGGPSAEDVARTRAISGSAAPVREANGNSIFEGANMKLEESRVVGGKSEMLRANVSGTTGSGIARRDGIARALVELSSSSDDVGKGDDGHVNVDLGRNDDRVESNVGDFTINTAVVGADSFADAYQDTTRTNIMRGGLLSPRLAGVSPASSFTPPSSSGMGRRSYGNAGSSGGGGGGNGGRHQTGFQDWMGTGGVSAIRRQTDAEETTWGRLINKWVGGSGSRSPVSSWFPSSRVAIPAGVTVAGGGSGRVVRVREPKRTTAAAAVSLSPPRSRRPGKERQLTLMEELYQDLRELKRRLEEVQSGIDANSDVYTAACRRYTRATIEAEEAEELKHALSAQMLQLLFEQEQRLEEYLRECITFDGVCAGACSTTGKGTKEKHTKQQAAEDGSGYPYRQVKNIGVRDSTIGSKRAAGKSTRKGSGDLVSSLGDDHRPNEGNTVTNNSASSAAPAATDGVSRGVYGKGDIVRATPDAAERPATLSGRADDDDGFEKVESWMAGVRSEQGGRVQGEDAVGVSLGEEGVVRRPREGSLLVPFPSRT